MNFNSMWVRKGAMFVCLVVALLAGFYALGLGLKLDNPNEFAFFATLALVAGYGFYFLKNRS
jgi:hypothetical protein